MPRYQLPAWTSRAVVWLVHAVARFTRPMMIGVRAVIFDSAGRVFLVRHSYLPGWHFPGGGVEIGETVRQSLIRETREEAQIEIGETINLHGVFFNRQFSRRDHIFVYIVRDFHQGAPHKPDWEILEAGFFDTAALPEGTSSATHARLREIRDGAPLSEDW